METGVWKGRLVILLAVVLTAFSAVAPVAVTAHEYTERTPSRVFFSDDPDPLAHDEPVLDDIGFRGLTATEQSISELARAYDFYYDSVDPTYTIGSDRVSFSEFQRQQLDEFTTSSATSRWMPTWGGPVDGRYIKDASAGIVGVEKGLVLHAPGTDSDGTYLIPKSGAVYTYADFRIDPSDLPENYCTPIDWDYRTETYTVEVTRYVNGTRTTVRETRTRQVRVDGDQWCYRYRLEDPVLNRSLWLGNQNLGHWGSTPGGITVATYSNLTASQQSDLRVSAQVTVVERTTERHRDWDPDTGWQIQREDTTEQPFSVHVTGSKPVRVSTNQELSVRQRVVVFSDTRAGIVLEFDGPPSLAGRRLWGRAIFDEHQELANVWGIYSVRSPHHGQIASNRHPSPQAHEFPAVPQLHLTARTSTPTPRYDSGGDPGFFVSPEVLSFDRERLGDDRHEPGPNIDLSTSPIYRHDRIVVKNAPGEVTELLDIHGDPIPLDTTVTVYRPTDLVIDRVDESRVRLHLLDPDDGQGLVGRRIHLTGARESVVRTDDRGVVTVRPTRRYLTAEFRGDDWTGNRDRLYGPARQTRRLYPPTDSLISPISDLLGQWRFIGFWVVLAVVGWLWYESR